MITAVLVCGFIAAAAIAYGKADDRARQAEWEAHVADAVEASTTPLYDAIAERMAADLDREWADLNGGAS